MGAKSISETDGKKEERGNRIKKSNGTLPPLHFSSRRSPIHCRHGCVATSQPLATSIGLHVLRGLNGNAADASVAVAAALAVLEPCSTGLGGDMFALWYDSVDRRVRAINGSGRSPAGLTLELLNSLSPLSLSQEEFCVGVHSITVPGAAQGWEDVVAKFGSGRLSLEQLLEPAAQLAEEGFPVSTITSYRWAQQMHLLTKWKQETVQLSVDGAPPRPGQLFRNPGMASVLRSLGRHGASKGFYNGFPGKAIIQAIRTHGGTMESHDLTSHQSTFPEPISVTYRGKKIWQIPPNGQGIAGLIALRGLASLEQQSTSQTRLMEESDRVPPQASPQSLHAQIEMMRLGFADARSFVCDPESLPLDKNGTSPTSVKWLLNEDRISKRALNLFDPNQAIIQGIPDPANCTVSFQVVDKDGNAISFVNSNYMGFGTGLTPPNCGFTLQNRGAGFSLDPTHPNSLAPSKRPYHTIIPAMVTHEDDNQLYASLSNMGGFMQPQGHLQLVVGLLANGLDPQTAIDAPRFCIVNGTHNGTVLLEDGFHPQTIDKLRAMGHDMQSGIAGHEREVFGRAQIIVRDRETGVLCAGSDGRADGCALGY